MLTPEQIRDIADTMIPLIDDLNNWIIRDIIKRLAARLGRGEAALLTATDEWQLQVYQEAGGQLQTVRRLLRRFMDASDEEIGQIFEDAGIKSLDADNRIYTAAGGRKLALSENMVRVMTDVYQRTKGTIHNFTRTTAEHSQQKLIRVLDTAHWKVNSGAQSYTAAYLDAINEIADTQTEVVYPSGHVDTIETAVLRAVRTGTAQAAGNLSIQGMEEHGWDLIRVSAHLGARYGDGGENPGNHFWWQGKLYSRSGEDTNYPPFIETTGYGTGEGLCGWNCRHSFGPGDPNHNPFKDYDSEENRKAYDLSQKQRCMERGIRKSKSRLMALKTAIDATEDPAAKSELEEAYTKAALRLKGQSEAYNQFCEDNDLKRFDDRLQVAKWDREQARLAIAADRGTFRIEQLRKKSHDELVKYFGGGDAGEQRLALLDSGVISTDKDLERLYKVNENGARVKKSLQELAEDGILTVSREALDHSFKGEFKGPSKKYPLGRLWKGGHSQATMDFMDEKGIMYHVVKTYSNGVRIGYVEKHKSHCKDGVVNEDHPNADIGQTWFPKEWTEYDIRCAGTYAANKGHSDSDDAPLLADYRGVRTGVYVHENGQVGTIFPHNMNQPAADGTLEGARD